MSYYFSKIIDKSFEEAINLLSEELTNNGFGIISDIDVSATFKKKLNVDFKKYRILGACSPVHALKALTFEDKIGTMLPCNIVVQELPNGRIEVAAVDPMASMAAVKNESLGELAKEVSTKLINVINSVE